VLRDLAKKIRRRPLTPDELDQFMLSATDPLTEEEDVASMAELLGVTSGEYRRRMVLSEVICGSPKPPDCPHGVPDEECVRANDEWWNHPLQERFDRQKAFVIGIRVPGKNDRASLAHEWRTVGACSVDLPRF